jgi:hypothetical protein
LKPARVVRWNRQLQNLMRDKRLEVRLTKLLVKRSAEPSSLIKPKGIRARKAMERLQEGKSRVMELLADGVPLESFRLSTGAKAPHMITLESIEAYEQRRAEGSV